MTRREGFTLVEVMVSLLIFGLLAAAGVGLLTTSITNREVVKAASDDGAALLRVHRSVKADLGQAIDRSVRSDAGQDGSTFVASGGEALLTLTRTGRVNPGQADRSSLQRVEYRLSDGRLIRRVRASVDAGDWGPPQVLMEGVGATRLAFTSRGRVSNSWPTTDGAALPDAVDLVIETPRFGPVTMAFMVGGVR